MTWEFFVGMVEGLILGGVAGFYYGWVRWGGKIVCPNCQVLNDPWLGPGR
jgi:ABC-type nitrate/sulfonate/bicarbonate transport system permease component